MPWAVVEPIIEPDVRGLCTRAYEGHPRGCPNYGKRPTCPPEAPMLGDVLDLAQRVFAVWNVFDFAGHIERMVIAHPAWSDRQRRNCRYWQGPARVRHRGIVAEFTREAVLSRAGILVPVFCPEACGVNVTATMACVGVCLEWPPRTVAYQVALVGIPKRQGS